MLVRLLRERERLLECVSFSFAKLTNSTMSVFFYEGGDSFVVVLVLNIFFCLFLAAL